MNVNVRIKDSDCYCCTPEAHEVPNRRSHFKDKKQLAILMVKLVPDLVVASFLAFKDYVTLRTKK